MPNDKKETSDYLIDEILEKVIAHGASDIHMSASLPPTIRVQGILQPLPGFKKLTSDDVTYLVSQILEEAQLSELFEKKEMDSSYEISDKGRFRVNVYFERRSLAVAMRFIPSKLPTLEDLNMPTILYEFCKLPQGLVLVTGATGSGKSTTIAALINWLNQNTNSHIITVEDPIEFRFISDKCLIHQREMRVDTLAWTNALKSALREDGDILLIGEIRDPETMSLALAAAEKGHLVFATIHTYSADQTIDHIISMYPEHQQALARMQLSSVLEGTVTQTLLIGKDKSKRYPGTEIMLATDAIRNIIREGNSHFIYNAINTSFDIGMITMERSLSELVNSGKVTIEEALSKSKRPEEVLRYTNEKPN